MGDEPERAIRGQLFDQVPELYDRVRPGYPSALFADLVGITGLASGASVLEVGCGTGQATRPLAERGYNIVAVEPGLGLAELARQRVADFPNAKIEISTFEAWEDRNRSFDLVVAASSWHWVDQAIGWPRAHDIVNPGGWMAILGNVVIVRPGEPELYAETADLHQLHVPDNPDWGHPPTEAEVRATSTGWGPSTEDPEGFFGPTVVRWYPMVQRFDGAGMADHLRSLSPYRRLDESDRERLLEAITDHIRTRMNDQISRHYLSVLRIGKRANR
ncbi:MAG: methyltransferase domain-containing protein [Rhodococcus sp. (in: high G+C Gram-positive bacteria)]